MPITARCAAPDDDLTTLWPESIGHVFNRAQVFVAVDDANTLLAGAIMFHGGHSIAYLGSIVFATSEQQGRLAHRLLAYVTAWCRTHGIRTVGHGAGTFSCCQAFEQLGATLTRHHLFMELTIEKEG